MNEFPQGGKRNGSKGSSPLESSYTSYESVSYGSNYSSPLNSRAGDREFGHMTPQNMQPSSNISVILQSMDNLNLQVRTKESPPFSVSGSSDRSEIMSFPSDVSFEIVEQPGISDSSRSSSSSQSAVFKASLDHTPVAIKVLRPDMSQGEKQFHREVEVLSRMRHPHMVILLGACPEYGCLVYEYMENGSLEDRLFRKDGTPPLSWRTRFRVAAEIATALNFLHRTRPEPLVHRDLKPANILLDKNYVSKIGDVGLSRLVPPSIADNITQYHMTAAAGTFCYIDPEYQQTGMLGTKSDIYSLGVMLLQIITAKPAMGLTHHVESAIETGRFAEVLDPTVRDWPVEETLSLAKLALKCCELRRRDRPDLDSVIFPELERLRDLGSQVKPEGRHYYMHPRSQSSGSPSSQASQNRFDYMNPQGQSFQASSSSSQNTQESSLERQMENQRKNAFASGSSTITTLGILD